MEAREAANETTGGNVMELAELLLSRVDPVTSLMLFFFMARQQRVFGLLRAHLVKHHKKNAAEIAEFVESAK